MRKWRSRKHISEDSKIAKNVRNFLEDHAKCSLRLILHAKLQAIGFMRISCRLIPRVTGRGQTPRYSDTPRIPPAPPPLSPTLEVASVHSTPRISTSAPKRMNRSAFPPLSSGATTLRYGRNRTADTIGNGRKKEFLERTVACHKQRRKFQINKIVQIPVTVLLVCMQHGFPHGCFVRRRHGTGRLDYRVDYSNMFMFSLAGWACWLCGK